MCTENVFVAKKCPKLKCILKYEDTCEKCLMCPKSAAVSYDNFVLSV